MATANTPGNISQISDVSDDGDDTDGNITNDQTIIPTTTDISMAVYKTAITTDVNSNSKTDAGDVITYTIAIENTGNLDLTGLTLVDTLTDANSSTLSLNASPTFVSASSGSTSTLIQVGDTVTYSASYTITVAAANTGKIINSVLATASSPGKTNNVSKTHLMTLIPAPLMIQR